MNEHVLKARVPPLSADDERVTPRLKALSGKVGYEPAALLTIARKPRLLDVVLDLTAAAINSDEVIERSLRLLVGCEAARTVGSVYSAAHLAHAAHSVCGLEWGKLSALPDYAESPLYTDRERTALRLASEGARLPVGPLNAACDLVRQAFSEAEFLELTATICAVSFLLHWNGIMSSELEDVPAEALEHVEWLNDLAPSG